MKLTEALNCHNRLDEAARKAAQTRWDSIAKPLHSLGLLEDALIQIAGIVQIPQAPVEKRAVAVFCADNGVVEEGVTQTDSSVTAVVAENLTREATSVTCMAKAARADVIPVDVGMNREIGANGILVRKTARGTQNFLKGPAMTRQQLEAALEAGISLAGELKRQGYDLAAAGEMGIGNTTTSSAVASVLLQRPVQEMTGRGAGLSSQGLKRKIQVIEQGIALHHPNPQDGMEVLQTLGGFDLAAMAGFYIGGMVYRLPVVLDGFISAAAALAAERICPGVKDFLLASHQSGEPAGGLVLQALGKKPLLTCRMCLGEGTGAVALFPLLDLAQAVYGKMSTFSDICIDSYEELQ